MSEGNFTGGHLIVAAVAGAVLGAGIALLLAPKSGKETREWLAKYLQESKDIARRLPEALKQASSAAEATLAKTLADAKASPADKIQTIPNQ